MSFILHKKYMQNHPSARNICADSAQQMIHESSQKHRLVSPSKPLAVFEMEY